MFATDQFSLLSITFALALFGLVVLVGYLLVHKPRISPEEHYDTHVQFLLEQRYCRFNVREALMCHSFRLRRVAKDEQLIEVCRSVAGWWKFRYTPTGEFISVEYVEYHEPTVLEAFNDGVER